MGKLALQKDVTRPFQFQSTARRDKRTERPASAKSILTVLILFLFAISSFLQELAELAFKTIRDNGDQNDIVPLVFGLKDFSLTIDKS